MTFQDYLTIARQVYWCLWLQQILHYTSFFAALSPPIFQTSFKWLWQSYRTVILQDVFPLPQNHDSPNGGAQLYAALVELKLLFWFHLFSIGIQFKHTSGSWSMKPSSIFSEIRMFPLRAFPPLFHILIFMTLQGLIPSLEYLVVYSKGLSAGNQIECGSMLCTVSNVTQNFYKSYNSVVRVFVN